MIKGTFKSNPDIVEVIVTGNNLMFFDVGSGQVTTIEGLKLDKSGVVKEFPDLSNDPDWRIKSINRLKDKIKSMDNEMEILNYIKYELTKFGWEAKFFQKAGFRPEKFK